MAKKAFVIGADCNGLHYARSDAVKIAEALKAVAYDDVDGLPTKEEKSHDLEQRFYDFARQCTPDDTLIFYFAGHGVIDDYSRELFLVLDSSNLERLPSTGIKFSSILGTTQRCKARNKLLILDCCQSAQDFIPTSASQNYLVLSASEKWEKAPELPKLEAGFLSYHVHKLLTESPSHLLDPQNYLTINPFVKELQQQVIEHNRNNPHEPVPNFVIFGRQSSDFAIAQIKTPEYAGLLAITPQFIEQERNKHSLKPHLYSCEQFYGANPQAQWWGIINGLVAERAIYADIKAHIHKALSKPINKPIITLVLGSGGMGKSTFLRQLAVDLAQDYKVFWLQDWESFESESIADNLAQDSAYQLICLDNWHRLDDEDKKRIKKWLEQHSELHSKIKWLLSDREEAKELSDFIYGKSCFDFDDIQNTAKAEDNKLLLTKVADKMTTWKETALELQNHTIANAKPFQILFVLYRWAGREEKIDFEDFETSFHKIIEDDIERLRRDKQIAGFANALIDFAYIFIKYNARLTQNTFLRLADSYNKGDEAIGLFANYQYSKPNDEVWGLLRYYLSIFGITNEKYGQEAILDFTKEDLAEAIIQKYAKDFKCRKKDVCTFCVKDNSEFSASNLLSRAAIQGIFNSQETINFVHELLAKGNSHPNYIAILITKNSPLKFDRPEELIEIIEQFIAINPHHNIVVNYLDRLDKKNATQKANKLLTKTQDYQVICKCFDILGKTVATQQKAAELLEQKNQLPDVICKCFDILGKTKETQQKATKLLEQTQDYQVICKCFDILGKTKETQQKATKLLEQTQDPQVICKCFDILGKTKETQQKATKLLEQSPDFQVICKCFDILGKTKATQQKATKLLEQKNQATGIICKCFDILGKTKETQQKATKLLEQKNQATEIICKCFDILGKTKETQQKASVLLEQKNQLQDIICKCFAILGKNELTKKYARQFMLDYANNEHVLARCVTILEEEIKPFALERLENWKELNSKLHLLQNCLYVCRNENEIKEIVAAIIKQKKTSMLQYISVLKTPLSHIEIWQQETTAILNNWTGCNRKFISASLIGNHHDLIKVKQTCQQILNRWEREISYQQERNYEVYHFHILKALAYPSADDAPYRKLVEKTASAMLAKEKQQPNFLGDMLYEAAYNIVHNQQYPAWIPEEEI